jgi:hypothetical protein
MQCLFGGGTYSRKYNNILHCAKQYDVFLLSKFCGKFLDALRFLMFNMWLQTNKWKEGEIVMTKIIITYTAYYFYDYSIK